MGYDTSPRSPTSGAIPIRATKCCNAALSLLAVHVDSPTVRRCPASAKSDPPLGFYRKTRMFTAVFAAFGIDSTPSSTLFC